MSNNQQPDEKKAPTIWHVLGIGALVGVILGFGLWSGGYYVVLFFFSPVASIIGAVIGVRAPREISKKWKGLWIGAVLGALSPLLLFILWVFSPWFNVP